jgi:glycine cleavage system regulatory protein
MRKNDRLSDALAYTLRLTCHDTPGIFGASLGVLERHGARIEGIATERIDAAFSGEHMLRIRAGIRVHDEIIGRMCAALEELATEMIVEIDRDSVEAGHLTVAANRNNPGL